MNCPGHCRALRRRRLQLPRAAAADGRGGRAPPQRAERRAARPAARAHVLAGRRAHLLHARADRGGGARLPRVRLRDLRAARRSQIKVELSTRPENKLGTDEEWDAAEAALAQALAATGHRVHRERGRRRLLRAEDRPAHARLARPLVADRDGAARLPDAAALRSALPGRRQRRAHAGDDPPRADRLVRALHRHPDRALRRRVPVLARAGAGADPAGRARPPRRGALARRGSSPATASRSTTPTRPSASGSATPSCRRSRT